MRNTVIPSDFTGFVKFILCCSGNNKDGNLKKIEAVVRPLFGETYFRITSEGIIQNTSTLEGAIFLYNEL